MSLRRIATASYTKSMKQPLISFITPVYNTEKYLVDCIESVVDQTDADWELILVDDGSTDSSGSICDEYAAKDSRIKVIHKQNGGQLDARLSGIRVAEGKYCTGLDSDDWLEINCVKKLSDILKYKEYDVISWNIRIVQDGKTVDTRTIDKYGERSGKDYLEYVCRSTDHSFCNKLIKTEQIREIQYKESAYNVRYAEDFIMIAPALCVANQVITIDEHLYNYRQLENSITHIYTAQRAIDYMESTKNILEIFDSYSVLSSYIESKEYENLALSVGYCIKQAFRTGMIKHSDMDRIRSHQLYNKIASYEKISVLSFDLFVLMKMLRLRLDRVAGLVYGVRHE